MLSNSVWCKIQAKYLIQEKYALLSIPGYEERSQEEEKLPELKKNTLKEY